MSPCFFPDGMYSTNLDVCYDGIADEPSTRVPRSCDGAGPRSKLPFGSSPAKNQSEITPRNGIIIIKAS